MKKRLFKSSKEFHDWLMQYHENETELWLIFYKKGSKKRSIKNSEAVEEALCFGWINGKVRAIDAERYMQRFTPRKEKSIWAESNKQRVQKLIAEGRMTSAGMAKVEAAKENGSWKQLEQIDPDKLPNDLEQALKRNRIALRNFHNFTANQRRNYLWWLDSAKRSETRKQRIEAIVERSENNIKPGSAWP